MCLLLYIQTYLAVFFSFGAGPERLLLVTVFSDGGESDFFSSW